MRLYCFKYKNYFNREKRSLDSINEFTTVDEAFYVQPVDNFNFADGVQTSQTVDANVEDKDYAVLTTDTNEIVARWYIMECAYSRYSQYTLTLMRDLVYDYKEELSQATCFVKKAMLPADSPLIFNKEDMTLNQILTKRIPIKDETEIPWLVAYLDKKSDFGSGSITVRQPSELNGAYALWADMPHNNSPLYQYTLNSYVADVLSFDEYHVNCSTTRLYSLKSKNGQWSEGAYDSSLGRVSASSYQFFDIAVRQAMGFTSEAALSLRMDQTRNIDQTNRRLLDELNGTVMQFSDGYYRLKVTYVKRTGLLPAGNNFKNLFLTKCRRYNTSMYVSGDPFKLTCTYTVAEVVYEPIYNTSDVIYRVPEAEARTHTSDSTYDILCAPYGVWGFNGQTLYDAQAALAAFQDMAEDSAKVIDVQIVPFCPFNFTTSYYMEGEGTSFDYIKNGDGDNVSVIICAESSSVKKRVPLNNLNYPEFAVPEDAIEKKIKALTDFVRITNNSSTFEFGIAQNNGLRWLTVSMTLLPINPYIKITPDFGGLYGQTFDRDPRGLVLSGNFSVAQVSDAWKNYQTQNKNYQEIFDRSIENMETMHDYERGEAITGAITGTIQAGVTGALLGNTGPASKVAGGVAMAGLSAAAGVADIIIGEGKFKEARDYQKDNYGYNLGNIQALPKTMTRQTAFNIDSMYFPVVEYYTCTEREKQALRDKITWDGMSVGAIGKVEDYESGFIKADIIRCPSIGDYHVLTALSNELSKGVYL